jgi:2',3'-cyclic-nucleotide 2'-phosphodiesterase (5'-nucleotidase family)
MGLVGCSLTTETQTQTTETSQTSQSNQTTETSLTTESSTNSTGVSSTLTTEITTEISTDNTVETTEEYDRYQDIYLYSTNDFHGGAYIDYNQFSLISGKIQEMRSSYDHVIALSNGDMLQGTAFSNYYYGKPFIEAMNIGEFDGFVIGNHEFDWGIEKIAEYNDGLFENGEANYPFLAANIVYKDSLEPLEFTIPYIISEVNGVKVGVIGLIGDVINSIAYSRVENILFLDPLETIENYAYELRVNQEVDVVVVYIHSDSSINMDIASLSGNYKVDAVFNGHSHWNEASYITRTGVDLAYAQSSSKDYSLLAEIKITFDLEIEEVIEVSPRTYAESELTSYDQGVIDIFNDYSTDQVYLDFINQILSFSEGSFDRSDLAPWGASVIRDYLGIDFGAVNTGGFRVNMEYGDITMGEMITIYPFDNVIKTTEMTGQQITDFLSEINYYNNDVVFDDSLTFDGTTAYVNNIPIVLNQLYTVGAVDYIFDKTDYDFIEGINISYTGIYLRDLLVEDLLNTESFSPYDGSNYVEPMSYFYNEIYNEIR